MRNDFSILFIYISLLTLPLKFNNAYDIFGSMIYERLIEFDIS